MVEIAKLLKDCGISYTEDQLKILSSKLQEQNTPDLQKRKPTNLECNFCDYKTAGLAVLEWHIIQVHGGKRSTTNHPKKITNLKSGIYKKKPCKCHLCGNNFSSKFCLKQHMENIHEKKKFSCDICNSIFCQKGTLSRHIAKVHEGKKFKLRICQICGYSHEHTVW